MSTTDSPKIYLTNVEWEILVQRATECGLSIAFTDVIRIYRKGSRLKDECTSYAEAYAMIRGYSFGLIDAKYSGAEYKPQGGGE